MKLNLCIGAFADDEREQMDFPDDAGLVCESGFEFGEVGLGLLAGSGLEAALELGRLVRPDRAEMGGHRGLAAFVAAFLDLPEQPTSGQVRAVPDLFREIALVRLQKPVPRLPRRIGRSRKAPVQRRPPPPRIDLPNLEEAPKRSLAFYDAVGRRLKRQGATR